MTIKANQNEKPQSVELTSVDIALLRVQYCSVNSVNNHGRRTLGKREEPYWEL